MGMQRMQPKKVMHNKQCLFCVQAINDIDYKNTPLLRRFVSSYGKVTPRRRNGVCAKHQRKLAISIKRARVMALLPYIVR